MFSEPMVSIIMPAYNAEKHISESIESVLNQTYQNWELIIVDDGSTDDTGKIAKIYLQRDKRINYHYQNNGKQGKARNTGAKNSRGKYLAFLDADDLWTVDKLDLQVKFLEKNPDIDLVFSQGYCLSESQSEYNVILKPTWSMSDITFFTKSNQIPILSVLMKTDPFWKVDGFSEELRIQNAEDFHLWIKLILYGYKFTSISARLFYYRIHSQQATYGSSNLQSQIIKMFQDLLINYNLEADQNVVERIKWNLFDKQNFETSYDLLLMIAKKQSLFKFFSLKLLQLFPDKLFRAKFAFHLC